MNKTALITGVTGQDGSYLAEFLLKKGYDVHGVIRRSSVDYRERIAHLEGRPQFHLHYGDMGDSMSVLQIISKVRPKATFRFRSTLPNLRPMSMLWECSACWRPYVCVA